MKRPYTFAFLLLILFSISGCKQRVYLTVNEPAAVHLNNNLVNGVLINRSFVGGKAKVLDQIDNALTLEGNIDQKGSKSAITGAFNALSVNPRFQELTIIDSMSVENRNGSYFPAPLTWEEVSEICTTNNADFLLVLEVYDTDTKIDYSSKMVNKTTPLGTVPVPMHYAKMTTWIKTGWRIYDLSQKLVLDEFYLEDRLISTGSGINPIVAAAAMLNREQAVKQISTDVGEFYANRVESQNFRVWRNYFNKGSRYLKMANRRAETGDWNGAAELWEKEMTNSKRKVAGRATYNMAISKEINGDPYTALELAQKAYADYRIKEGLVYAQILRKRITRLEDAKQRAQE